jgi:hypothetical protein
MSPEGTTTVAVRPAGAVIVEAHGVDDRRDVVEVERGARDDQSYLRVMSV